MTTSVEAPARVLIPCVLCGEPVEVPEQPWPGGYDAPHRQEFAACGYRDLPRDLIFSGLTWDEWCQSSPETWQVPLDEPLAWAPELAACWERRWARHRGVEEGRAAAKADEHEQPEPEQPEPGPGEAGEAGEPVTGEPGDTPEIPAEAPAEEAGTEIIPAITDDPASADGQGDGADRTAEAA